MKKAKIIIPALLLTLGVLGGCRPGNGNSSSVSSDKPSSVVTSEATSEATSNKTSEPTSEVTSETPSTSETTSEVTTITSVEEPSSESPTSETPVTSSSLVTPSTSEAPSTSETTSEVTTTPSVEEPSSESPTSETPVTSNSSERSSTSETPSTSETTSEVTTTPSVEEPSSESPTSETPVTSSSLVTPSTSEAPTISETTSEVTTTPSVEGSSESISESISSMISSIFSSDISSSEYSSISQETKSSEEVSSEEISSDNPTSEESSSSNVNVNLNNIYGGYYASISSWTNGEDLRNQLQDLIDDITYVKYDSNWEVNQKADQSQTNFDMLDWVYSKDEVLKTDTNYNGKGWQKEHVFCQSLMNHFIDSKNMYGQYYDGLVCDEVVIENDLFKLVNLDAKLRKIDNYASVLRTDEKLYTIKNGTIYSFPSKSNDKNLTEICSISDVDSITSSGNNTFNFKEVKFVLNNSTTINIGDIIEIGFPKANEGKGIASDYHNLYASFYSGNSSRSNKILGSVSEPTITGDDYKGNATTFEPSDEDKGLLARALLYMDTCYDDMSLLEGEYTLSDILFSNYGVHGNKAEIVSWAQEYLVDYHEYQHNVVVQSYQGNRNPYIDFPGLVNYVYGDKQNQAGTLLDVFNTSAYVELSLGEHNYKNLAIANVKYEYQVGQTFTKSDIGNAYIVYTDLSQSSIDVNTLDFSMNNYTFKDSDIGTKTVRVSDGKTSVEYTINIVSTNPMDSCEYFHSFFKENGDYDRDPYASILPTNPLTLNSSGMTLKYSISAGKIGSCSKTKGVAFGSGSAPVNTLTIETEANAEYNDATKIKSVYVNASTTSAGKFTLSVYVGDTLVGNYQKMSADPYMYEFVLDTAVEGKLRIEFTNVTGTIYLKDIAVNFE